MSDFTVETGIPVPPKNYSGGNSTKYPWPQMEHGSSFLVECEADESERVYRSVINSGKEWIKRHKPQMKLMGRKEYEEDVNGDQGEFVGYRFWMIDTEQS